MRWSTFGSTVILSQAKFSQMLSLETKRYFIEMNTLTLMKQS